MRIDRSVEPKKRAEFRRRPRRGRANTKRSFMLAGWRASGNGQGAPVGPNGVRPRASAARPYDRRRSLFQSSGNEAKKLLKTKEVSKTKCAKRTQFMHQIAPNEAKKTTFRCQRRNGWVPAVGATLISAHARPQELRQQKRGNKAGMSMKRNDNDKKSR